jgi:hypothetical protein
MAKKAAKKQEIKSSKIVDVQSARAYAKLMGAGVVKPYYVCEDGNIFQDINNALNHATPNQLKYFICE